MRGQPAALRLRGEVDIWGSHLGTGSGPVGPLADGDRPELIHTDRLIFRRRCARVGEVEGLEVAVLHIERPVPRPPLLRVCRGLLGAKRLSVSRSRGAFGVIASLAVRTRRAPLRGGQRANPRRLRARGAGRARGAHNL